MTDDKLRDLKGAADFLKMHIPEGERCCGGCGETARRRYEAVQALAATADAPPEVTEEDKAYRIAAKMCPTCGLFSNNYCRDPFHASTPCAVCGTPAFVDRDEEQWWRQYCALGPELRLELIRFASALKSRAALTARKEGK